jgi:hypothetical protein
VSEVLAQVDTSVVVSYFDRLMVLTFDIDRATEALNAVIAIHEAVTSTEFERQAVPYCTAGISVGKVAEFAAYNNNSLYYRGHPVDKALEFV